MASEKITGIKLYISFWAYCFTMGQDLHISTMSSIIMLSLSLFQISVKCRIYLISPSIKQIVPDLMQACERDTEKLPLCNVLLLAAIIIPFLSHIWRTEQRHRSTFSSVIQLTNLLHPPAEEAAALTLQRGTEVRW